MQAQSRRAAELHFKASHAQQHQDQHQAALAQAQQAIHILEALLQQLKPAPAPAAEAAPMFGVPAGSTAAAQEQKLAPEVRTPVMSHLLWCEELV